ncbi:rho-associated protein kinase 2-like [Saccostrea cucullata]|uniref:rho-associated protein kinase 2-like n=1 Tax=Saccostrea cuccullata TaxID=36930 RepID=UPI002ED3E37B
MFQFDKFINNWTLRLLVISVLVVLASVWYTYFNSEMTDEDVIKDNEQFISPDDAKDRSNISSDLEQLKLRLGQLQENLTLIDTDRESMSKTIENLQSYSSKTDANIMSNNKTIKEIKENVKELNDALDKMKNDMAIKLENSDKRIISLEADLHKCNSSLQTLKDKNAQNFSTLENKLNILSQKQADIERKNKELKKKMLKTEKEIKEQGQTGARLEKSSEENINYMKKVEITSYWVDIILVLIILILLITITTMTKGSNNRNTGVGFAPDKGEVIQLEKKPAVVSFNPFSSEAHKRLADLFLDDYHYIIVHSSQDISNIQSKVEA